MNDHTEPTPENTPLPGGGSWRWSDVLPGWIPSDSVLPEPQQPQETQPEQ